MVWLSRAFGIMALGAFAAAVWYAGPLISFDDERILESSAIRALIIGISIALVATYYLIRFLQDRRAQKALEAAIAKSTEGESDAEVLEERMSQAIATLRRSHGRRNFLYDLPWYLIIGPPGAGKTTALVNSGLNFPLAGSGEAQPVAGVGGTRYCDWWFTDEAVLIDTAGRYTTQDSDARRDSTSWLAFLSSLKRHRPTQPINGVILAISLHDLITLDGQVLGAHVAEIRNRLREIHETLRIAFPVYVLFTKADLIVGFAQYFATFDESMRRQVWGTTFQTADRTRNMIGEAQSAFDALVVRLSEDIPDRLIEEVDPSVRIALFGFPVQFARLREQVIEFLKGIFDPARHDVEASLRGFYFSSGTQEGTPIDQILGVMQRTFGRMNEAQMSGSGRSFFLHDLMTKVIFQESGWVSSDRQAQKRTSRLRYAGFAAIGLLAAAALGAISLSFASNSALIASVTMALDQYRNEATAVIGDATVGDIELEKIIGALEAVRSLPAGYANRDNATPMVETFGLSQRDRLLSASVAAYRNVLERLLRPRLMLQLEEAIDRAKGDAGEVYEPLRAYLLLSGEAPRSDDLFVISWFERDWERNRYPGAMNRSGREELEKHLQAMLLLDDAYEPGYALNKPLVEAARRSLSQLTLAQRAAAITRTAYHKAARFDFSVSVRAGTEAHLALDTINGDSLSVLRVPGIYTFGGFNTVFLDELAGLAERLVEDRWVLGAGGAAIDLDSELGRLGPELLYRYGQEFVAAWHSTFDRLKLRDLTADKPDYLVLSAVASPTSPITRLFETAAEHMALTRLPLTGEEETVGTPDELAARAAERTRGLARIGLKFAAFKSQTRATPGLGAASEQNPVAAIEAQMRPFSVLADGMPGQRPIDILAQNFRDVRQSLRLVDAGGGKDERASANLRLQISNLRANASRLPRTLSRMIQVSADDLEVQSFQTSISQLSAAFAQMAGACNETLANRFPFSAGSAEDLPLADFGRVFAPGGLLDLFFARNLSDLVDMTGPTWQWKQAKMGREFSDAPLRQFQLAAEIRDAFFLGRQPVPSVRLSITPFSLHGEAVMAILDVDGQLIQSFQAGNSPTEITWPANIRAGVARLSISPEIAGRESAIGFDGPWALKRLLDRATTQESANGLELRFLIGGRDVVYVLEAGPRGNPFSLPALSSFGCPQLP